MTKFQDTLKAIVQELIEDEKFLYGCKISDNIDWNHEVNNNVKLLWQKLDNLLNRVIDKDTLVDYETGRINVPIDLNRLPKRKPHINICYEDYEEEGEYE